MKANRMIGLFFCLALSAPAFGLMAQEQEKVNVKVNTPVGEVQYQKGNEPPPQTTKVVVERPVVVEKTEEKRGCSCAFAAQTSPVEALTGAGLFLAMGTVTVLWSRARRGKSSARGSDRVR